MQNLLIKVYKNKRLSSFLHLLSHAVSLLCVLVLGFDLAFLALGGEYADAAVIAASLFVGFVLVSLVRKAIDAPRPYELYGFYEDKPKEREGRSFPSRHAYSAFSIATAAFSVHPLLGGAFILLASLMCASRVLLGIHFIRDVVCGALLGIIAGGVALIFVM